MTERAAIALLLMATLYLPVTLVTWIRTSNKILDYDRQAIEYTDHHGAGDADFECQLSRFEEARNEAQASLSVNLADMLRRWNEDYLAEQPPCN